MTFLELAQQRYSERYFDSRPVEKEKLDLILEAGRIAPTGCNYQPQRVYVIQSNEAMKKAISTKASLCGCPIALLVCYDREEVWKNPGDRCYKNYNCGEQDACSVAVSMIFEAEELGVHSLWIRGFDSQDVIDALRLPENHVPVMILALGYPSDKSHPAHLHGKRKPLQETVKYI
ncbi:MAG: nitroreductase family protein [Clostridia bacterium]|nr:nitroreductase family protein [Clostridia bacterium]MBQ9252135.1 nitroreductase family protein [Clostridia bacterium]